VRVPVHYSYRDKHGKLRDGRWTAGIVFQQSTGSTLTETEIFPADKQGIFDTEEEARAYNVALFCHVRESPPPRKA